MQQNARLQNNWLNGSMESGVSMTGGKAQNSQLPSTPNYLQQSQSQCSNNFPDPKSFYEGKK